MQWVKRSLSVIRAEVRTLLLAAEVLEAALPLLSRGATRACIGFLSEAAESLGNAMYRAGYAAPSVSDVRKRSIHRVRPAPPEP